MNNTLKKGMLLSVTFLAAISMASVGFAEPAPGSGFEPAIQKKTSSPAPAPQQRAEPARQAAPAPAPYRAPAPAPAQPVYRAPAPAAPAQPVYRAPAPAPAQRPQPAQQQPVRQAPPQPVQQAPARQVPQQPSQRPQQPAQQAPAKTSPAQSAPAQNTPQKQTGRANQQPAQSAQPAQHSNSSANTPVKVPAGPAKQVSGAAAQSAVSSLKKNGNVSKSGVNANIPDASHVKAAKVDANGNVKQIVTDKGTTLKMSAPNAKGQQHVLSSVKTLPSGQTQKVKYNALGQKSEITRVSKSGAQITVRKNAAGGTAFSSTVIRNNQKITVNHLNSHTSYVSKTVNVRINNTNITVIRNTYIRGGNVYVSNYRPYGYYRGFHIYGYMPAYYYNPFWYNSYVFNPWGVGPWTPYAGIAWGGWGWGWYSAPYYRTYYGWYYHPYTHYYAPAYWVTDYLVANMVANSLADSVAAANASAADAAQSAIDAEDAAAQAQEASQADAQQVGISDDMKNQIATQVTTEIQAQQAAQADPNAPVKSVQDALSDAKHMYVVSDDSDETLADGSGDECSLSSGDILQLPAKADVGADSPTVDLKVISSKYSKKNLDECKAGTLITKSIADLQTMESSFNENVDSGMKELAEKSKTDSTLPKPAQDVTPQSTMSQQDIAAEGQDAQALVAAQAKEAEAVETTTDDGN